MNYLQKGLSFLAVFILTSGAPWQLFVAQSSSILEIAQAADKGKDDKGKNDSNAVNTSDKNSSRDEVGADKKKCDSKSKNCECQSKDGHWISKKKCKAQSPSI